MTLMEGVLLKESLHSLGTLCTGGMNMACQLFFL